MTHNLFQSHPSFNINNNLITKTTDGVHSIYGQKRMYHGVHRYKFDVVQDGGYGLIYIGIDDANDPNKDSCFCYNPSSNNYGLHKYGSLFSRGKSIGDGPEYSNGSTIELTLNLN